MESTKQSIDAFTLMVAELYYGENLPKCMGEENHLFIVENRILKGYPITQK
jgi:hypothetical protein